MLSIDLLNKIAPRTRKRQRSLHPHEARRYRAKHWQITLARPENWRSA
jgi:hypothetical protein